MVILLTGFMGDQTGKINYINHAAGNGDYGETHGLSYNWKDIFHEVPSCQDCEILLPNAIEKEQCTLCLNWNPLNAHCSEEYVKQNGDSATWPHKLTMEL